MMKYLLLMFFIPLSFAGSPPNCGELASILENSEKDLQKKFINDCGKLDHKEMVKDIPVKDAEFLDGKLCSDLATIETQLEKLKIEEGVLSGIDALKTTIETSKEKAESSQGAREAGMTFVSSLNTAQSLEVLLQTSTEDEKPFVQKLKEFPEDKRKTPKDLENRLAELCKEMNKSEVNACNPKVFKPNEDASKELLALINSSNPDAGQVVKWQNMLAIKRKTPKEGDAAYSFTDMQAELKDAFAKIDNNEVMSKEHLKAIAKLDDFEDVPGLSFVENIAILKDKKKAKIASDKFFLLIGDAKLRQQFEVQSKLSVVWNNTKDVIPGLSDEDKVKCENSKSVYSEAKDCYTKLADTLSQMTGDAKANLARFLPALKIAIDHADKLEERESFCKEEIKTKGALSESCYAEMNKDLATVQDQILQLNLLKDKIGSENTDLMTFRNFALKKWGDQKCQVISSTMDLCSEATSISKDVFATVSDAMKITILFAPKSESEEEAEKICDDSDKKTTKAQDRLCEFFNDTTSNIVTTKNEPKVDVNLQAPDGGNESAKIKDAWIQGGANVLQQTLNSLFSTPPAAMANPYPYNYNPFNNGTPPMGVADSILFNARYYGAYGFYMPTPGYQPYTAFGVTNAMTTPYRPVSGLAGNYFGF